MRYLILIIALAGLIDSTLALKVHYDTGTEPCSINAHWDCGIVNHSSFSMVHGVPVAAIGIAGYLLLAILALARRPLLLLVASGAGLAYAIYLSGIEKNVLQTWCLYCVISQCIIALITLLSLVWLTVLQIGRRRTT
jgi:vitamin-K-epoxide reductase (warfarin-sensitive)